jgi:mono/diheme cytochrome c family protein
MKLENLLTRRRLGALALMAAMPVALLLSGCVSTGQARPASDSEDDANVAAESTSEKGGAQLWAARCTQCHYARDPGVFSPQQWDIIMLHMRVRANLTAAEHRAILEFFKSAN